MKTATGKYINAKQKGLKKGIKNKEIRIEKIMLKNEREKIP
jgi:hypothetical protein